LDLDVQVWLAGVPRVPTRAYDHPGGDGVASADAHAAILQVGQHEIARAAEVDDHVVAHGVLEIGLAHRHVG
jgi:hypothetical protein